MKRRFGGLLSLALGIVLIAGGTLTGGGSGAVGALPCSPTQSVGSAVNNCPTGKITITQHTAAAATFAAPAAQQAAAPANFTVKITSTCLDPGSAPAAAVNQTVSVPTGGSASSGDLYIYTDQSDTTKCSYTLAQTAVAGYTASFDPPSPETLTIGRTSNDLAVTLTDTAAAASSTSSEPSSSSAASSSSASPSASVSVTVVESGSSNAAAPLANTGPRSSITFSLVAGIALCLLGLVLLLAGRFPGGVARRRR